ncbi:MAG: hypothetical protein HYY20_00910 [Candidatus Tectomicrobia bacterium]|uniref:Uncharacterized protein n=1 Tax=Tectimicrobiota bacterium TaxID=2528274 RepID=A0A932CM41_UNCTE|nr:hypothetical protein [Candidatus Tectomicrobia bacterium]
MRRLSAAIVILALVLSVTPRAWADAYEEEQAGNPWRVLAYVIHPIGVALDRLVARPLHQLMHYKLIDELTGHSKFSTTQNHTQSVGAERR